MRCQPARSPPAWYAHRRVANKETSAQAAAHSARQPELYSHPFHKVKNNALTSPTTVSVSQCGSPADDAIVNVDYLLETTKFSVPGYDVGNGNYAVSIPVPDPNAGSNIAGKCDAAATAFGHVCDVNEIVKPLLPLACAKIVLANVGLGATCITVAAGSDLACSTLGYSATSGSPSIADQICANVGFTMRSADFQSTQIRESQTQRRRSKADNWSRRFWLRRWRTKT